MKLIIDPETNCPVFYGKPLTFNEKRHTYKWGGDAVPSVTTILQVMAKPALIQWAANTAIEHIRKEVLGNGGWPTDRAVWEDLLESARTAHTRIRDKAGDVGTLVHKFAQDLLSDKTIDVDGIPSQAEKALNAFNEWRKGHEIKPVALERRIFSREHQYAGTCDFFGYIDDTLCVLDFKTGGTRIYDEAWLQTAGYLIALREELGIANVPVSRWVVHLDKNTGKCAPEVRPSDLWDADRLAWLAVVNLEQCMRQIKKAGYRITA